MQMFSWRPKPLSLLLMCGALLCVKASAYTSSTTGLTADPPSVCGGYTFKVVESENEDGYSENILTASKGGKTYFKLSDSVVDVQQCGDLTGDGVPEVVLMEFSGGAHCCATHSVYTLSTPPRRILYTGTGHSDTLDVLQLDAKGPKEIVNTDWRFAYAYGLGFANSPALPRIYRYENGVYVERTRQFPDFLLNNAKLSAKDTDGQALANYALLLLANQPQRAQAYLQTLGRSTRAWLENYAPDIKQDLMGVGREDWLERAGKPSGSGIGGSLSQKGAAEYLAAEIKKTASGEYQQLGLRLLWEERNQVKMSPLLLSNRKDIWPMLTVWHPQFGRDVAILRQDTKNRVEYSAYLVGRQQAQRLGDDPLAAGLVLLSELGSVARNVEQLYGYNEKPLSVQQKSALQQQIKAAIERTTPLNKLNAKPLNLDTLRNFVPTALELKFTDAQRALLTGVVEVQHLEAKGQRFSLSVSLQKRGSAWVVSQWALTPRQGELTW